MGVQPAACPHLKNDHIGRKRNQLIMTHIVFIDTWQPLVAVAITTAAKRKRGEEREPHVGRRLGTDRRSNRQRAFIRRAAVGVQCETRNQW